MPALKLLKQAERLITLNHVAPMGVLLTHNALRQPAHVQQLHVPAARVTRCSDPCASHDAATHVRNTMY